MVIVHEIPTPGPVTGEPGAPRRSDAGTVRFTSRDITGLALTGDMHAAPYDLLAAALDVTPGRLRAITARWRRAGLAETGRIGPGPGWCWLTHTGMRAAGLRFPARPPSLARLAHTRAVLAIRIGIEAGDAYRDGGAWWRSERRIRSAAARPSPGHLPDAEVLWPGLPGHPYGEEIWAIEAELTPKPAARTTAIMDALLSRTAGWEPGSRPGTAPRYDRVIYLCAPAALPVVRRAAARLAPARAGRVTVRELPAGALLGGDA